MNRFAFGQPEPLEVGQRVGKGGFVPAGFPEQSAGGNHLADFGDFVAVNVACLDHATDRELAEAPVTFQNGRDNAWESPPPETRYL